MEELNFSLKQKFRLMKFREREEMGLFTFYMQQQLNQKPQTPPHRYMKSQPKRTHKKTKSHNDHPTPKQPASLDHSKSPAVEPHKNRMTQQYDQQRNKRCGSKILSKLASHLKSPKDRASIGGKGNFKFPLAPEHLSPSAKLKAHLDYLTTQQSIPQPSVKQSQSVPSDVFRPELFFRKFQKPILKGINLNQNVAEVLDSLEKKKYQCPKKLKMKTRYSFKHVLSKQQPSKQTQNPLPQLLSHQDGKNFSKMLALEAKRKKVESCKWKNPVKQGEETYLDPIITDRQLVDYSVSFQFLSQPHQFRVPELRKNPTTVSIKKESTKTSDKQHFKLENSHLFKTVNIHDYLIKFKDR